VNIWRFWLQGQINSIFTVARDTGFNAAELGQPRYTEMRHWLQRVDADDVDSSQGQFFSLANMAIEAALNGQGLAIGLFEGAPAARGIAGRNELAARASGFPTAPRRMTPSASSPLGALEFGGLRIVAAAGCPNADPYWRHGIPRRELPPRRAHQTATSGTRRVPGLR